MQRSMMSYSSLVQENKRVERGLEYTECIQIFLKLRKEEGYKESTLQSYFSTFKSFYPYLLEIGKEKNFELLTEIEIRDYLNNKYPEEKTSAFNSAVQKFHALFNELLQRNIIKDNPSRFIKKRRNIKIDKKEFLSKREVKMLLGTFKVIRLVDLLLIDEPEASFDNIFLNDRLREMIKNISRTTTVFLTTRNNALGSLMSPDKVIYTEYEDGFHIYSGPFGKNDLVSESGKVKSCRKVILDALDSGEKIYEERGKVYEIIKN